MRLDRIYTKLGDKGQTLLATGQKVSKAALRLEAYGGVDELNAHLGLFADLLAMEEARGAEHLGLLRQRLLTIQHELFDLGGELATPLPQLDVSKQQVVDRDSIARLEGDMDAMLPSLSPLQNFVLPGGHPLNSQAHIARCVCRRAERCVVRLSEGEAVREEARIYLNRLSDWLFVASRMVSLALDCKEVLWKQQK